MNSSLQFIFVFLISSIWPLLVQSQCQSENRDRVDEMYIKFSSLKEKKASLSKRDDAELIKILRVRFNPNCSIFEMPDFHAIGKMIAGSLNPETVKAYLDFIVKTADNADEGRSYGLARIYTRRANDFLAVYSKLPPKSQKIVFENLYFGIVNNFYHFSKEKIEEKKTQDKFKHQIVNHDKSVYRGQFSKTADQIYEKSWQELVKSISTK